MKKIACYITGHGFGHAVRVLELCRNLDKNWEIHLKTAAPQWLVKRNLPRPFSIHPFNSDIGAIQKDCFDLDIKTTLEKSAEIFQKWPELIPEEKNWVRETGIDIILSDIPPLAFIIAKEVGIPSVGLTNFSWDWIYSEYTQIYPRYQYLVDEYKKAYGESTLLLRLPQHGDLSAFPNIIDIPHIARIGENQKEELHSYFKIPDRKKLILMSFGGIGLEAVHWEKLETLEEFHFLSFSKEHDDFKNMSWIDSTLWHHQDLVKSVDAVVTKPGYGIVAECMANQTPMVYADRDHFLEYAKLVEGIKEWKGGVFLNRSNLLNGDWESALLEGSRIKGKTTTNCGQWGSKSYGNH